MPPVIRFYRQEFFIFKGEASADLSPKFNKCIKSFRIEFATLLTWLLPIQISHEFPEALLEQFARRYKWYSI
ncbi:hypothetical protein AV942_16375 [Alteromonas mediterranea]|uniref:Uncharacterized protein n=1 Tax=Alteromonas mediterranea TaxID=314275 RepID=A0AAC8XLJ0_9ALTE|nr:hypothetical protein AV942_16375 [Alteromonas mediterranea]AMJ83933.1 hypothetical protein AV941_16575 [Alteromonas mediterranea]